jgi:predicted DNA-binding transcriptional regulator AlpA
VNDALLTADEVASLLKISKRSVHELCRNRTRQTSAKPIPIIRLNPKCIRFSRTAIENWIADLQKESVQ